jgi:hypothetical protein
MICLSYLQLAALIVVALGGYILGCLISRLPRR